MESDEDSELWMNVDGEMATWFKHKSGSSS